MFIVAFAVQNCLASVKTFFSRGTSNVKIAPESCLFHLSPLTDEQECEVKLQQEDRKLRHFGFRNQQNRIILPS
jgi:hypothetical protein